MYPGPVRVLVILLVWAAIGWLAWMRIRQFRARRAKYAPGGSDRRPPATPTATGGKTARPGEPELEFGFRGEDITYRDGARDAYIAFTHLNGPRIYTDSMRGWKDGPPFSPAERREILGRAVAFVTMHRERPVVVVNVDDPLAPEWLVICDELRDEIRSVGMNSDAEYRGAQKKMFMDILAAGKGLTADGEELRTEADVDRHLDRVYPPRSTRKPE